MGQGDILKVLKDNKDKWLTEKEISHIIGVGQSSPSLRKLRMSGEILARFETIRRKNLPTRYEYKFKQ